MLLWQLAEIKEVEVLFMCFNLVTVYMELKPILFQLAANISHFHLVGKKYIYIYKITMGSYIK